jgi:hypothetical protein
MRKTQQEIGMQVDTWITEEDLPSRADIKPLKQENPAYLGIADPATGEWILEPMDDDEIEAYREHLHWFMTKDYHMIMTLPATTSGQWFPPDESADYARLHPDTFDRAAYRIKKIYERVKDLADTYAAVSHEHSKKHTHEKYVSLIEKEFRDKAVMYLESYRQNPQWVDKQECFRRIRELNCLIMKCKEIWQKHSEESPEKQGKEA